MMAPKPKYWYDVYLVRRGNGVYGSFAQWVGESWAVSGKKAASNVRFNLEGKRSNWWLIDDYAEEGSCSVSYEGFRRGSKELEDFLIRFGLKEIPVCEESKQLSFSWSDPKD